MRNRCASRWLNLTTVMVGKQNRGNKWAGEEQSWGRGINVTSPKRDALMCSAQPEDVRAGYSKQPVSG